MKIWVDADATPADIKKILFKAAQRRNVHVVLVANQVMGIPASPFITSIKVGRGPDVADKKIVENLVPGDLVITAAIPLAAEAVARDCHAISPRGEVFGADSIGTRISIRDFLDELRGSGIDTGGPSSFNSREKSICQSAGQVAQ